MREPHQYSHGFLVDTCTCTTGLKNRESKGKTGYTYTWAASSSSVTQLDGVDWSAQAQPRHGSSVVWGQGCEVWGAARAVWLHDTPASHPSPIIRVCTPVCAEAVRSCDLCSGFGPAKALVRWPPLPRPRVLPSRVRGRTIRHWAESA